MSTPALNITTPQARPVEQAPAARSSFSGNTSSLGFNELSGQSSFLSLLLGQIGEGGQAITLENLNIDFAEPQNVGAFQLSQTLPEHLQSLNVGDNVLNVQNQAIGNNQDRLTQINQKIREFLASLLDSTQTAGAPTASATNAAQRVAANQSQTNGLSEQATALLGQTATTEKSAQSQTPINVPQEIVALINSGVAGDDLFVQISELAGQNPDQFLRQASILSSGLSIQDLNALQNAAKNAGQIEAQTALVGVNPAADKTAAQINAALAAGAETANKGDAPITNRRNTGIFGAAVATASGATDSASASTASGTAGAHSGTTATAAIAQNAGGQLNTPASNVFSAGQIIASDNNIFIQQSNTQTLDQTLAQALQPGADATAAKAIINPQNAVAHASLPHPASESFAAQVQRMARADGSSRFTIEMDPPELGRVEVDLKFGSDKGVKANILVERPETLLMLQRDSGVLQKALQEMGLDFQGSDLNFQMAGQNGDKAFSFDQDSSAKNGYANAGFENGAAGDVIQTDMTLIYIDPATGFARVNILA